MEMEKDPKKMSKINQQVKQDLDPLQFKERLKNYITNQNSSESGKHKPLEINEFYFTQSGSCIRALYYSKAGIHKKYDYFVQGIFLVGNVFHEFVQKNILTDFEPEQRVTYKYENVVMRGRVDAINENYIVELKSWMGMKEIADIKHILQLNMGLHQFQNKKGLLIYIDKRTFTPTTHVFDYNKAYFENVMKKFKIVIKCLEIKTLPEMPKNTSRCKNCYYKKLCNANYNPLGDKNE